MSSFDNINALSYGNDRAVTFPPIEFSLANGAQGMPGTAVRSEAERGSEVAGDIFTSYAAGENVQVSDEDGVPCSMNTFKQAITAGTSPTGIAIDGDKIYVTNKDDDTLSIIDTSTYTETIVSVGDSPTDIAINPKTEKIYVVNQGDDSVTVISQTFLTTFSTIAINNPEKIAVNPETNVVYVISSSVGQITVIDGSSDTITDTISLPSPSSIDLHPLTNRIYVTDIGTDKLYVIDGAVNRILDVISVGTDPCGVAVNTNTNMVYVSNTDDDTVSVVDGFNHDVVNVVSVQDGPRDVSVDQALNQIYVSGANSISVIDDNDTVIANVSVSVGTGPGASAVDLSTHLVYITNSVNVSVLNPLPVNTGTTLQLNIAYNVDGMVEQPPSFVDPDANGIPDGWVYLTLTNSSPTLQNIICPGPDGVFYDPNDPNDPNDDRKATAADILRTKSGLVPTCWAGAEQLGLDPNDDLDALCIEEDGDGMLNLNDDDGDGLFDEDPCDGVDNDGDGWIDEDGFQDRIVFSLADGSPTLSNLGTSASTLLVPGPRVLVIYGTPVIPDLMGLGPNDDIDALKCQLPIPGDGYVIVTPDPVFEIDYVCDAHLITTTVELQDVSLGTVAINDLPLVYEVIGEGSPSLGEHEVVRTNHEGRAMFAYVGSEPGFDLVIVRPQFFGHTSFATADKFWDSVPVPTPDDDEDGDPDICDLDDDNDGIVDDIDGLGGEGSHDPAQLDFTDQHLGGSTYGTISDFNGVAFHVDDIQIPGGILIAAAGYDNSGTVSYCGMTELEFTADTPKYTAAVIIECDPIDPNESSTTVVSGQADLNLDTMSGTLMEGTSVDVQDMGAGLFMVTNAPESIDTMIGGMIIPPGDTILLQDTDSDGWADDADNCPNDYNPDQNDTDNDGIGDECECYAANLDGLNPVNFEDYAILAADWLKEEPDLAGDTNRDGVVNINDVAQLAQHWLESCP